MSRAKPRPHNSSLCLINIPRCKNMTLCHRALSGDKDLLQGPGIGNMQCLHAIRSRQRRGFGTFGQGGRRVELKSSAVIVAIFPGKAECSEERCEPVHGREVGKMQSDDSETAIFNVSFDSAKDFLICGIAFSEAFVGNNNCFEGGRGKGADCARRRLCALDMRYFNQAVKKWGVGLVEKVAE